MSQMGQKAAESIDAAKYDLLAACEVALEVLETMETSCIGPVARREVHSILRAAIQKAHALPPVSPHDPDPPDPPDIEWF